MSILASRSRALCAGACQQAADECGIAGARIFDPRQTRNHLMKEFRTDSWDALRFDRAESSGSHAMISRRQAQSRSALIY